MPMFLKFMYLFKKENVQICMLQSSGDQTVKNLLKKYCWKKESAKMSL